MSKPSANETDPGNPAVPKQCTPIAPNLKGDWSSFFLLLLLFTVQGLPIGVSTALPIIFQSKKGVTYKDQALFSLSLWPYSMKLLWAPIVDNIYIMFIGRRKSWLIVVQYLLGMSMVYMASNIDEWLPESGRPNIEMILCVVFFVNLLSATQTIVVDGWALTMLKKHNVSYSSTCSGMGMALGICIGSVCSVLLQSKDFRNTYLQPISGASELMTFKNFLYLLGMVYMVVTTLVGIFKKEKTNGSEDVGIKLAQNYKLLWDIVKLPNMRTFIIALLTSRIGYSAMELSHLKLIDAGVSQDDITIISMVISIVHIILPLFVSKYTSGLKPLNLFLALIPIRILWNIAHAALIYYTPFLLKNNETVNYNLILGFVMISNETVYYIMLVAIHGFFSRICDPRFGGTYMTLLNTVNTLGWAVPKTLALKLVGVLTIYKCTDNAIDSSSTSNLQNICKTNEENCVVFIDGYYIEIVVCMIIGFIWYKIFKRPLKNLQSKGLSYWIVDVRKPSTSSSLNDLIFA